MLIFHTSSTNFYHGLLELTLIAGLDDKFGRILSMDTFKSRNFLLITDKIQSALSNARIAIIGCGLGSVIAELLARLGSSRYHPIINEMVLFPKLAQEIGINAKHVKVQDLSLKDQKLYHDNEVFDCIYQKFDVFMNGDNQAHIAIYDKSENELSDYWKAIKQHDFMCLNPYISSMVAENKKILCLLLDKDIQEYLSSDEIYAINQLCLKSYDLTQGLIDNQLDDIAHNKDQYVLKKVLDTRGRGVYIGKAYKQKDWIMLLKDSIGKPIIAQEYVEHPSEEIVSPFVSENSLVVRSNLGMFMINGKACGLFCRSSPQLITNIALNGALRPVYVIGS